MSGVLRVDRGGEEPHSALTDLREGFSFVRQHAWLWGTLIGAAISLLAFWGPVEVLVPYRIKNDLGGGADDFGLVLAAGGVGAILAAVVMAQLGLPRKHMTFMYVAWAVGCLGIAGLAFASVLWQAMVSSFVQQALFASGPGRLGDADPDARPRRACSAASRASTGSSRPLSCRSRLR